MKKFWKYLTLTILLLVGLCCVGILYLFFIPGSSLFGIQYVSYGDKFTTENYNATNIETIVLNSNRYNVNVVSTKEEDISVYVYNNSFGFVTTKNKDTFITTNKDNEILTFNVKETSGFTLKNASEIELRVPQDKTFNIILTNNKARTDLNGTKLNINNLTYKTNSGDLRIINANISGYLNLNLKSAACTISEIIKTSNSDVTLNITNGKFDASNSTFKNISIESNTRGIILAKECANLTQNTTSAGGRIDVKTASYVNITSSSTNVYINKISNGAIINLSGNGDIKIENLTGEGSTLSTNSGDIYVNIINSYTELSTKNGNITVANAFNHIDIETSYGDVVVIFNEKATNKYLSAALKDGKLYSTGLEKINLIVEDNGRADLEMSDVKGTSLIQGKKGSIFIKVNKLSKYKLNTASEGSVRVNLAQIPEFGGYTDQVLESPIYVNCTQTEHNTLYSENILEVYTTTGSLTILDSNFA